jgi:hypothetical protein
MSTTEASRSIFSKEQIMGSALFSPKEKDMLDVILLGDKSYTLEDAKHLLELFLNKEVI